MDDQVERGVRLDSIHTGLCVAIGLNERPGVMLVENVYDYEPVLSQLNDPSLHILEVPPVRTQYSRCLVKFNF